MDSPAMLRSLHHQVSKSSLRVQPRAMPPGLCFHNTKYSRVSNCKEACLLIQEAESAISSLCQRHQNLLWWIRLRALILEVCDERVVAEVKLRIGDFEMHLKLLLGPRSL